MDIIKKIFSVIVVLFVSSQLQAQWKQTNAPHDGNIYSLASNGTNIFAGDIINGVFRSTDNGANWTQQNYGLNDFNIGVYSFAVSPPNVFAGTRSGTFLSSNNGKIWDIITNSPYSALSFSVSGTNIIAGSRDGVWLSTNYGINWDILTQSPAGVLSVVISGANILIATQSNGVYLSTNLGTVWAPVNDGLNISNIHSLALSRSYIFAGTDEGIYLTTNNGINWTLVNNGLPDFTRVSSLAVIGNNIFAGTNVGVFVSTNNGTSWNDVGTGLINMSIMSLAEVGTYLVVGTNGWGVWRRPISEIISSVGGITNGRLPKSFELKQNYPNPFNPSTKINYALPFDSKVTLEVFNLAGIRIAQLVDTQQSAGNYSVDFNSSSINRGNSSGVYFYRLIAANKVDGTNYSSIKKMMILK